MALKLPTPPTPPTIDKGEAGDSTPRIDAHQFFEVPFKRNNEDAAPTESNETLEETPPPQPVERRNPTPEEMAREAVANGAGALTRRNVTRPNEEENQPAQNTPAPANSQMPAPATQNLPSNNSERGKEILREFQNEDRQNFQNVETPRNVNLNHNESYSGFYWIGMIIFAVILSFVFVRKFLVKKNPKLKKSDLFEDADKRLQAVSEKVSDPKINPVEKIPAPNIKPVATKKSPPKNDDDKGKYFEVRV